jgi:mannose-6-phosphate isomerase-like protein (cupin superfamily)
MELKEIHFSTQSSISFSSNGDIKINLADETLTVNKENKPRFENNTGELVIEFSGLASDQRTDRSLALVRYSIKGYSQPHYHNERTEDYYIISGKAKVIVDGKVNELVPGESITIPPKHKHQVISIGEQNLEMMVKCTPAWVVEDQNFVDADEDIQESKNSISL